MTFKFLKLDTNRHGGQFPGKEKKGEMVRGFKIQYINLTTKESPGINIRFILYFPSGKCCNFDFYSK